MRGSEKGVEGVALMGGKWRRGEEKGLEELRFEVRGLRLFLSPPIALGR